MPKPKTQPAKPTPMARLYPRNLRDWEGRRWKLVHGPRTVGGQFYNAVYKCGELEGFPSLVDTKAIEEGEPPVKVLMQLYH